MEQESAICAFAVMSNHYHLAVHVDQQRANSWSPQEVIEHWCVLFSKPPLIDRWLQGVCGEVERDIAEGVSYGVVGCAMRGISGQVLQSSIS